MSTLRYLFIQGALNATPLPLSATLHLRRPTAPPFSTGDGGTGGGGGELQHGGSSQLFTTPQLANPKASILHT